MTTKVFKPIISQWFAYHECQREVLYLWMLDKYVGELSCSAYVNALELFFAEFGDLDLSEFNLSLFQRVLNIKVYLDDDCETVPGGPYYKLDEMPFLEWVKLGFDQNVIWLNPRPPDRRRVGWPNPHGRPVIDKIPSIEI